MQVPFRWTAGRFRREAAEGKPKALAGEAGAHPLPASVCPARRASDRSTSGGSGGGGAALSPPPEGSTDNKSRAKRRAEGESGTRLCNTTCPLPHLCWARIPGDQGAAGGSEGPCAPEAAGDGGGLSGLPQVPPAGTRCPGAVCPWIQARGSSGVGSSSVQWLGAQVPGLAGEEALLVALGCVSPLSPPPLFSPPPFPTTPAAAASKCEKCQGDFPAIGEGDHVHCPRPLFEILA